MAKALRLGAGQSFSAVFRIPCEVTYKYEASADVKRAHIQDENGNFITPISSTEWLRGNDGDLVYSNDNQIIEGVQ